MKYTVEICGTFKTRINTNANSKKEAKESALEYLHKGYAYCEYEQSDIEVN